MIDLKKITIKNFGPYIDQTIDLPGSGVFVVHGNNGHGKTTLLNAFQWLFSGEARKAKSGDEIRSDQLINKKAIKDSGKGSTTTEVCLDFVQDKKKYRVTRTLERKANGQIVPTLSLLEESKVFGTADSQTKLDELLPPPLREVFFFDAELLEKFEQLRDKNSSAARELTESIENVLGIPFLRTATTEMRTVQAANTKELAKLKGISKKNKEIYNQIATLERQLGTLRATEKAEKRNIKDARRKIFESEKQLKQNQDAAWFITEKGRLQGLLEEAEGVRADCESNLGLRGKTAWRVLLAERVETEIAKHKSKIRDLVDSIENLSRSLMLGELQKEAQTSGTCPCCGTEGVSINEIALSNIEEHEKQVKHRVKLEETLQALEGLDVKGHIIKVGSAVQADLTARNKVSSLKTEIAELEEKLEGIDQTEVQDLVQEIGNQRVIETTAGTSLSTAVDSISEKTDAIEALKKATQNEGNKEQDWLSERDQKLEAYCRFFEKASERYRDDQRDQVEKHATAIFNKISHQNEYEKLSITDDYGLEIIKSDGSIEDMRSAGFEHIVAVSLIGALQQTSPVQGPVVMDSPFGKLDLGHGHNVLSMLPELASQIILLVTDRETNEQEIADSIKQTKLIAQRKLRRVSVDETEIEAIS